MGPRSARAGGAPPRCAARRLPRSTSCWQTAVGAWPISTERLQAYATKAVREAKEHTTWTEQDADYEADVAAFVAALTHRARRSATTWRSGST